MFKLKKKSFTNDQKLNPTRIKFYTLSQAKI